MVFAPVLVSAQVNVAPDCGTGGITGIPVPCLAPPGSGGIVGAIMNAIFFRGPAGQITATGVILSIINIALWIVGLVSVLFVIIGGFRYITAHGNEEATEGAKKTVTQAIIGVVIVVLSFVIIRVIVNALILGSPGGV